MGRRLLLKDPKPLLTGFECPVTQRDYNKYSGCDMDNATFRGTHGSGKILILGKFRCACGKNVISRVSVGGREMTPQRYEAEHQPVVELKQ